MTRSKLREPGNAATRRRAFYAPVGVSSVTLERLGDDLLVYAEIDGVEYEIIREYAPGTPCNHWVSAGGIRSAIEYGMDRGRGRRKPKARRVRTVIGGRFRPKPRATPLSAPEGT